jgi:hypothetical protein
MISRRILATAAVLCSLVAPTHAQKTKAQLNTEVSTTFPDNTTGSITPFGVRTFQNDLINSIMPTAPVVSGNLVCFNGTTGLLQDCGSAPTTVPLTVGVTPIAGGTTTNVLFDNAGKVGEYSISGAGSVCMTVSCAMTTPNLGTPSAAILTNATGLPIASGVSGLGTGVATVLGVNVGSTGAVIPRNGDLGTPSAGVLTNATGLPVASGVSGLGTGVSAALANAVNASGGIPSPTPTRAGDIIYWNGSSWVTLPGNNSGTQLLQETSSGVPSWVTVSGTGTVTSVICGTGLTGGTITTSGTCAVDYATKSDQQTGTATAKTVNPAHQQDHDSAAKVWVTFTGSTGAILSSYNVGSMSRTGLGEFTINFTTAFASANYVCQITSETGGTAPLSFVYTGVAKTASLVHIAFENGTGAAFADPTIGHVVCYGRQ